MARELTSSASEGGLVASKDWQQHLIALCTRSDNWASRATKVSPVEVCELIAGSRCYGADKTSISSGIVGHYEVQGVRL